MRRMSGVSWEAGMLPVSYIGATAHTLTHTYKWVACEKWEEGSDNVFYSNILIPQCHSLHECVAAFTSPYRLDR